MIISSLSAASLYIFIFLLSLIFVCMSNCSAMALSMRVCCKGAHTCTCANMFVVCVNVNGLESHCTRDESGPPTYQRRPSIPTKCFNEHLDELISSREMMAV